MVDFVRGMDDRLGGAGFLKKALKKVFPDHWTFMLGEIAMYSFVDHPAHRRLPDLLLPARA